jgi:gamma-glutamyltranspeptidase/glutathione hydrolase
MPSSVYQSMVNVIDFKMTPNSAVNSAKFHHQWLPEIVFVEKNFPENTIKNLEQKNYKFEKRSGIGRTEMIVIDENGNATAVADSRGDDSVAVE